MAKMKMSTNSTARKVIGSTAGAGLGGALGILIVYILETYLGAGDLPTNVENAITTVMSAVTAYFGGYYVRPDERDTIEPDTSSEELQHQPQ